MPTPRPETSVTLAGGGQPGQEQQLKRRLLAQGGGGFQGEQTLFDMPRQNTAYPCSN
jgi:hypothetical protein